MEESALDIRFEEAVIAASAMSQSDLPQDVQLRLYAYYKQATFGTIDTRMSPVYDLRNAFKTNAWMQISHLSQNEAKEMYIEMITALGNKKK
jgi:acyl-CoA-binding protein